MGSILKGTCAPGFFCRNRLPIIKHRVRVCKRVRGLSGSSLYNDKTNLQYKPRNTYGLRFDPLKKSLYYHHNIGVKHADKVTSVKTRNKQSYCEDKKTSNEISQSLIFDPLSSRVPKLAMQIINDPGFDEQKKDLKPMLYEKQKKEVRTNDKVNLFGVMPIAVEEVKRQVGKFYKQYASFLPMCILFSSMTFVNTIISTLSHSIIITAKGGGADVIPFLTIYAAFPLTILCTLLYTYASRFIERKKLFTYTLGIFAIFNLIFALAIYPNHELLHLHKLADNLTDLLPGGFSGAIGMIRNWTFSLFFCVSELWGDLGLSLLFWGFCNDITSLKQAPVLYPLIGIGANVAQALGGLAIKTYSSSAASNFNASFQGLLLQVVGFIVLAICLHRYIASKSENNKCKVEKEKSTKEKSKITQKRKKQKEYTYTDGSLKQPPVNNSRNTTSVKNGVKNHRVMIRGYKTTISNLTAKSIDFNRNLLYTSEVRAHGTGRCIQVTFRSSHDKNFQILPLMQFKEPSKEMIKKHLDILYKKNKIPKTADDKSIETKGAKIEVGVKKKEPGFLDSLRNLTKNPVIASLATMTIAQAVCVTLMEYIWRSHLRLAYPTPAEFSAYMGTLAMILGIVTGAMMILSPILFNKIKWKGVASITPGVLAIGGSIFFSSCIIYHIAVKFGMGLLAQSLLPLTITAGSLLYVLSRGSKFSLFKPSEEMVFIKMNKEDRMSGKAAVDVVGANVGKTGGSILQQILLVISSGHLFGITPVMFGIFLFMMKGWEGAIKELSEFQDAKNEKEEWMEKDFSNLNTPDSVTGKSQNSIIEYPITFDDDYKSDTGFTIIRKEKKLLLAHPI